MFSVRSATIEWLIDFISFFIVESRERYSTARYSDSIFYGSEFEQQRKFFVLIWLLLLSHSYLYCFVFTKNVSTVSQSKFFICIACLLHGVICLPKTYLQSLMWWRAVVKVLFVTQRGGGARRGSQMIIRRRMTVSQNQLAEIFIGGFLGK